MQFDWTDVAQYLSCPDDGAAVQHKGDALQCLACARRFPLREANLVEMLPCEPLKIPAQELPAEYRQEYLQAFAQKWADNDAVLPFGAPEALSPKQQRIRERQTAEVSARRASWDRATR